MNPFLHDLEWLDDCLAGKVLGSLIGHKPMAPELVQGLAANGHLSAYLKFVAPAPIKLYEPDGRGGFKPVDGPLYRAQGRWRLVPRGQGIHEIERPGLEAKAKAKSLQVDPDGIWVEGLGPESGLRGRLCIELRPGLTATSPLRAFLVPGYANPWRPSQREEDYAVAPRLPRGVVIEYCRTDLVRLAKQKKQQLAAAPASRPLRLNATTWQTLSLMLLAMVAHRRRFADLDGVTMLARTTHEILIGKGIMTGQQDLLVCLLFAKFKVKPLTLSETERKLLMLKPPSPVTFYGVVLDVAMGLHRYDPNAPRNAGTATIERNARLLALDWTRARDAILRQLKRAVALRWPAEIERMAQRPRPSASSGDAPAPDSSDEDTPLSEPDDDPANPSR